MRRRINEVEHKRSEPRSVGARDQRALSWDQKNWGLVDEKLGSLIAVAMRGTNQRDAENSRASATILVASREHGPVQLPEGPEPTK